MMRLFVALTFALVAAGAAGAQQLTLEIQDGRVTLEATQVPVRQILAEWARVGGTRVVGGDKLTGAPLTLRLRAVPERQALDIILRNAAGYMAAPRQASATPGASLYDRILILATSAPPAAPTTAAGRPGTQPGAGAALNRRLPPRPPNLPASPAEEPGEPDVNEPPQDDPSDTGVTEQPVFTFPAPPNQQFAPFVPFGRPGQPGSLTTPVITLQPNPQGGQPTVYQFVPPAAAGTMGTPTTTFGVIGSPTPGVVIQPQPVPPQGQQPQRPPPQ
jgi:hypothetical protein